MLHLNQDFRQKTYGFSWFVEVILGFPETYEAISVKDFIDERQSVKPSTFLKCAYNEMAEIIFSNVNLEMIGKEHNEYRIYDVTGEIIVQGGRFNWLINRLLNEGTHESVRSNNLVEGRYYEITIMYTPSTDSSELHSAKQFGPPEKDKDTEKSYCLDGLLGLSPQRARD